MRNLILLLIAFIAVVTFIRAYDKTDSGELGYLTPQTSVEVRIGN